jgi:hypothetical protein
VSASEACPVVRELTELRRGRGLDATDLHARVGPRLREACDIGQSDIPAVVRRKLILRLTELCGRLPSDLQLAALVALGLHEEASGEFLDRRISWLANRFDRDPRTARRRIDDAFRLLGEYLDEDRCIVAATDELDEIVVALSVPRQAGTNGPAIEAQMIYGGELVESQQVSPSHARFVVRLPRPLGLGQRHEYGIQFTPYPRPLLRPYYVLTPLRRCEHFTVRVRFHPQFRPAEVWRLNGLPARVVDDCIPGDDRLSIDNVGDISLEFHALQQGLSYGLQWSPPETAVGSPA